MTTAAAFALVFVPMLAETALSSRNERGLRAAGAVEPAGDVYRVMAIAYPAAFVALLVEGALRGAAFDTWFAAGMAVFAAAKTLKYWAIASLGGRWTFRVLVPPGSRRTAAGPYRWMGHPNYVAVAGELAGVAIAMHAWLAGPPAVAIFGFLMLRRIKVEESALART
jgi:methyltransferase